MINIHLNGDIVRCPDIANMLARNREIKDKHNICRYNVKELDCEVWKQSITAWQKFNDTKPRCMLSGCDLCPGHQKRKLLGSEEKTYKVDNSTYRKCASSGMFLYNESKSKTLFLTLTFPEFKKNEYNHLLILTESERNICLNEVNKCFSKFVENLRSNYNCEGYVAVREFGSNSNRVHFHLLCAIPFVPFDRLNAAWCAAISDISVFSRRAVTTDPEARIIRRNPARAIHYICKYFSKAKGQQSGTRLVFISNNILQRPKNMDAPLESVLDSFKFDYMKQTSDYTTCYRITDNKEFNRFCEQFLYPFFELSAKKSQSLYTFPLNTS
jgi:hypothetical protein